MRSLKVPHVPSRQLRKLQYNCRAVSSLRWMKLLTVQLQAHIRHMCCQRKRGIASRYRSEAKQPTVSHPVCQGFASVDCGSQEQEKGDGAEKELKRGPCQRGSERAWQEEEGRIACSLGGLPERF